MIFVTLLLATITKKTFNLQYNTDYFLKQQSHEKVNEIMP
jgi:hypothetical protein